MKSFLIEYGQLTIGILVTAAILYVLITSMDFASSSYKPYDIYVGVDDNSQIQEINAVSNDEMYSVSAPVIVMTNEGTTINATGEYEDKLTFASEDEARNYFIPSDLKIIDGSNELSKENVISDYDAFDVVVEVYEIKTKEYEIEDKFGNEILNEDGESIKQTGVIYSLIGTYSYKDESCPNLAAISLSNKNTYKFVVTYRYTSSNSLKAETQHIFCRKAVQTPLKIIEEVIS
jgi:hypothetical protein